MLQQTRRFKPTNEVLIFFTTIIIIFFLVGYPIVGLFGGAFISDGKITTEHFEAASRTPFVLTATVNTLIVGAISTLLASAIGVLLAWIVAYTDTPFRDKFELISVLPFVSAPILTGIAWIILADRNSGLLNVFFEGYGIPLRLNILSMEGLIFTTTLITVPFVFFVISGVLRTINPELEETAKICGSTGFTNFRKITLPIIMPAITSAAILAFMYSNILFGIHTVIGMPANIWLLTTAIYSTLSVVPVDFYKAAVLALILVAMGGIVTWIQIKILSKKEYVTITGKGFRTKIISLGRWKYVTAFICGTYIFIVGVLPYIVLFIRSLRPYNISVGQSFLDLFSNLTLEPYYYLFIEWAASQRGILNSFILANATALICLVLTAIGAYIATRTKFRGRRILNYVVLIPMALPGIVVGVAAIFAYAGPPFLLYGTMSILLIAYVTRDLPLAFKSSEASFIQLDKHLEESARTCGASWLHQFRTIVLPLVKPGMLVGWVLVYATMFRELGASVILFSRGNETIAYILFSLWEDGNFQVLSALTVATGIIALATIFVILKFARIKFAKLVGGTE